MPEELQKMIDAFKAKVESGELSDEQMTEIVKSMNELLDSIMSK